MNRFVVFVAASLLVLLACAKVIIGQTMALSTDNSSVPANSFQTKSDWQPPAIARLAIVNGIGIAGYVRPGGTYQACADSSDTGGNPPSGVARVVGNFAVAGNPITSDGSSVSFAAGAFTCGGESFNYLSPSESVDSTASSGTHTYTVTSVDRAGNGRTATGSVIVDGIAPTPTSLVVANEGLTIADAPAQVGGGGALVYANGDIYGTRGHDRSDFWRFDPNSGTWTSLADMPDAIGYGAGLTYANGYIYAVRGNNHSNFWRYDLASNAWSALANAPQEVGGGGALAYSNGYIYALRGDNHSDFWRYDLASNRWSNLANAPKDVSGGGALVYSNGYIYALRGGDHSSFWRYDVSANAWSWMSSAPGSVSQGGALAEVGGYIYAFAGNDHHSFWRFDPGGDSWASMTDAPHDVGWGGALADGRNGCLYALEGNDESAYWCYKTGDGTWETSDTSDAGVIGAGDSISLGMSESTLDLRNFGSFPLNIQAVVGSGPSGNGCSEDCSEDDSESGNSSDQLSFCVSSCDSSSAAVLGTIDLGSNSFVADGSATFSASLNWNAPSKTFTVTLGNCTSGCDHLRPVSQGETMTFTPLTHSQTPYGLQDLAGNQADGTATALNAHF